MLTASCLDMLPFLNYSSGSEANEHTYNFSLKDQKRVKLFKFLLLAQNLFRYIELPRHSGWIPVHLRKKSTRAW